MKLLLKNTFFVSRVIGPLVAIFLFVPSLRNGLPRFPLWKLFFTFINTPMNAWMKLWGIVEFPLFWVYINTITLLYLQFNDIASPLTIVFDTPLTSGWVEVRFIFQYYNSEVCKCFLNYDIRHLELHVVSLSGNRAFLGPRNMSNLDTHDQLTLIGL